ncbi:MAG: hypothetical protein KKC46_10345 [Proteobacteria bacterium]|nr:hypothetical protein [Pseudomonadota bacterium]
MKMNKMKFGGKDLIVDDILNGISRDVLYSLSFEQLAEIKKAVEQNLPKKIQHSIDVHFSIPLLFKRFYFVFSSGPDNRGNKKPPEEIANLRVKTQPGDAAIVVAGFLCMSAFIGTILYKIFQIIPVR